MIVVRRAFPDDIRAVFAAVAHERAAEMTATAWHDDPTETAEEIIQIQAMSDRHRLFVLIEGANVTAIHGPIGIVGVLAFGPGYGGMIWAATKDWPALALPSHRWWHRRFVPEVLAKHYRRVEFTALAADTASQRWLKTLGFTEEGIAYRQGKRGEDFIHFAWLNPDPTVGVVNG